MYTYTRGIIGKKPRFETEEKERERVRKDTKGMGERGEEEMRMVAQKVASGDEAWLKSPARQKTQIDQNESYAGQKKVNDQDGSHAFRASGEFSETRQ